MSKENSQKEEFTLKDLDNLDERDTTSVLAALVNRTASLCSIEFLRTEHNDVKPHVVFNLKVNPRQSQSNERYMGCRLSMEYGYYKEDSDEEDSDEEDSDEEGFDEEDSHRGTFIIKALPYMGSSNRANASFDFEVNTQITIKDWIKIFRGSYEGLAIHQQTDLTLFKFVVVDTLEDQLMDGCRDFICQCFLGAYHLRIVQGYSNSLTAKTGGTQIIGFHEYIPLRPELGTPNSFWFFDIIDKNFKSGSNNTGTTFTVVPTPMHRGVFLDPRFRRIETFGAMHYFPLNYDNQPAAQNPAGNNGQGGAPGGAGGSPQGGPGQPGVPPSNSSGSGSGSSSGAGRGGPTGGPTGGPPGNQLGTGAVGGKPTPTNPGMGLAPVEKIGTQTGAPLTSRPKIPDTVTAPPATTTQTRPPSAQTATATKVSPAVEATQTKTTPAVKDAQTKTAAVVKRYAGEDNSSSEGNAGEGTPSNKKTKG